MISCKMGRIQLSGKPNELIADLTCIMKALKDNDLEFVTEISYKTYNMTEEEMDEAIDEAKKKVEEFKNLALTIKAIQSMTDEEKAELLRKMEEK